MARIENEEARCQAAMAQIRTFPVIDQQYRIEMVFTNDERYQILCHYLDMDGWIDRTIELAEAIADTPEAAVEGWNKVIEERRRV